MGLKLNSSSSRVYCVIGDGEQGEGQIWEAAMAAAAYKADKLCAILDYNKVQATDTTDNVFPIHNLKEKWTAFGWHVIEINGHDIKEILDALEEADTIKDKPSMILAHTIKGKGFPFAENSALFHNGAMMPEQYTLALEALENMKKEV